MGRPSGHSGAGLEEPGARGSTVWGAKLDSDGSPRRGRRGKGQSRGTAWRVILQASPVTIPSERAMNPLRADADFPSERLPRAYNFRAMLNYIWLGLMVLAVVIGGGADNPKAVGDTRFG